ncbi:MAG: M15 family metallopeptidase [Microlunatus sp.]
MTVLTVITIVGLSLAAIVCLGTMLVVRYVEGAFSKVCAAGTACSLAFTFGYIAVDFAGDLRREAAAARPELPPGFVYVPGSIDTKLRYAGPNNLTGQVVDGYVADDVLILRIDPALSLMQVQSDLAADGLGLRVSDAYRPARADRFLLSWAQTPDTSSKVEFYPELSKRQLVERGYLQSPSPHSLGATVDVTLVDLDTGKPLDLGSPIGFFGAASRPDAKGLSAQQARNRATLASAMHTYGFRQDRLVWWQFSHSSNPGAEPEDFEIR